ncbi:MAG: hypothetical protein H0U52_02125 [Chloroflexi bacterium]|nr:hypothetical protein [Chloroflexota bacterium]
MALAITLGGCDLLMSGAFGPGFNGDFPSSSPIATYSRGTATVAIAGGESIVLDQLGAGANVDSMYGSEVRWTGPNGWNVRLSGAGFEFDGGGELMSPDGGYLTLDRIDDGKHSSTFDGSRCIVDITVIDASALRGSATCKGLEWYDVMDMLAGPAGPKPLDQPKFDAEVSFEAVR